MIGKCRHSLTSIPQRRDDKTCIILIDVRLLLHVEPPCSSWGGRGVRGVRGVVGRSRNCNMHDHLSFCFLARQVSAKRVGTSGSLVS